MRAIVVTEHGGPEVLRIQELPDPVVNQGDVLIRVKAFGLNHADTYMRSGIWPFGIPVLGIEAAGTVEEDPSGRLDRGTRVVAVVGGMARTRNGSWTTDVPLQGRSRQSIRWSGARNAGRDRGLLQDKVRNDGSDGREAGS